MSNIKFAPTPFYVSAVSLVLAAVTMFGTRFFAPDMVGAAKPLALGFISLSAFSIALSVLMSGRQSAAATAVAAADLDAAVSEEDLVAMDPKDRKAYEKSVRERAKQNKKFAQQAEREAAKAAKAAKRANKKGKHAAGGDLIDQETDDDWIQAIREANMEPVEDGPKPSAVVYEIEEPVVYAPPPVAPVVVAPVPLPAPVAPPVVAPVPAVEAFNPAEFPNYSTPVAAPVGTGEGLATDAPMFEEEIPAPEPIAETYEPLPTPMETEPAPAMEVAPGWLTAAYDDPNFVPPYDDDLDATSAAKEDEIMPNDEPVEEHINLLDPLMLSEPVFDEPAPGAEEVAEEPAAEEPVMEAAAAHVPSHRANIPVSEEFAELVTRMEEVLIEAAERTEAAEAAAVAAQANIDAIVAQAVAEAEARYAQEAQEARAEADKARAERDALSDALTDMEGNLDQVLGAQAALAAAEKARVNARLRQLRAALSGKLDEKSIAILDALTGEAPSE